MRSITVTYQFESGKQMNSFIHLNDYTHDFNLPEQQINQQTQTKEEEEKKEKNEEEKKKGDENKSLERNE